MDKWIGWNQIQGYDRGKKEKECFICVEHTILGDLEFTKSRSIVIYFWWCLKIGDFFRHKSKTILGRYIYILLSISLFAQICLEFSDKHIISDKMIIVVKSKAK